MDAATPNPARVTLGFDAARGFAPGDLTSPGLAAQAAALVDVTMPDQRFTELRIHGVSGSNGPIMLEHPNALEIEGDSVTGFYRRWSPDGPGRPSVPWKLEAYSWGGMTEKPLGSASWLLLAPFMMYNVAHFMLPPQASALDSGPEAVSAPFSRDRLHWLSDILLRLLALAATIQLVAAAASVALSSVAWQSAGRAGFLPTWMGWYGELTTGERFVLALAAVGILIAVLAVAGRVTESRYEARESDAEPVRNGTWNLTEPRFWKGKTLVRRQRAIHLAAACATAALIAALPSGHAAGLRWLAIVVAVLVLLAACGTIAVPMTDRHDVTIDDKSGWRIADRWCTGILAAGIVSLAVAAIACGFVDQGGKETGALPGLAGFWTVLLAVQVAVLAALAAVVAVLALRADALRKLTETAQQGFEPFFKGNLATLVTALGVVLGWGLSVVVSFGVSRLLGTPVPSGAPASSIPANGVAVPAPLYALGAAPIGMVGGLLVAVVLLGWRYLHGRAGFENTDSGRHDSDVAAYYAQQTVGRPGGGDHPDYRRSRRSIAAAWSMASLTDHAGDVLALVAAGAGIAVVIAEVLAVLSSGSNGMNLGVWWHGLASFVAAVAVLVAGWLVTVMRQEYSSSAQRKTVGALWDVATFWPRAAHPLAPPCYAERAVPEVVDRIRVLTGAATAPLGDGGIPDDSAELLAAAEAQGLIPDDLLLTVPCGPVLLNGYSQGSIIAAAVVAQLPAQVKDRVALLTLACPARRLYGRAFPAYFGLPQLEALRDSLVGAPLLGLHGSTLRWRNLCRKSDYIGGWIFQEPVPDTDGPARHYKVDQPCWDPVILVPDATPTKPPVHRHSAWWQDTRTREVSGDLVDQTAGLAGPPDGEQDVSVAQP
jgi:hypothetical protein